MDIRLLDSNDMQEAKALWKSAFGDSDAFIDTYFENKISQGSSLGMFDKGLSCVVHMLPYRIRVQGKDMMSSFIAGAATAQDKRKRGLMRTMLYESLKLMKERGILMTHLYPFKHSFYEQFSWVTYTYVNKSVITTGKQANVIQTQDVGLLSELYQNMMKEYDGYVLRSEKEWEWRLSELFCDGGKAAVLIEENKPAAYMLYFDENSKAEAIEMVFTDEEKARRLAQHLALEFDEVRYNTPTQDIAKAPHGMARVVNAAELLEEFGATELLDATQIVDIFAPWNNIGSGMQSMDVSELAKTVHRGVGASLCKENVHNSQYNILKEKFIARETCIFEEY